MLKKFKKTLIFSAMFLIFTLVVGFWLWKTNFFAPANLQTELAKNQTVGAEVVKDFLAAPAQAIERELTIHCNYI